MNKQSPADFIHIATGLTEETVVAASKDFDRMEERIQMVEEMIEDWKDAIVKPENKNDKPFLVRAFSELSALTQLVDHLYAEWIQLDEEADAEPEPKRIKNQIVC